MKTRIIYTMASTLFLCPTSQFNNLELCIGSQGVLSSSYIINDTVV